VERRTPSKGRGNERVRGVETPSLEDGPEDFVETWVELRDDGTGGEREIEELIVRELVKRHQDWIDAGNE